MSNHRPYRHRPSSPPHRDKERERPQSNTPDAAANGGETPAPVPAAPVSASLNNIRSLEKLREKVELAVSEIERLRNENVNLMGRIKELESELPNQRISFPQLVDEEPEYLRKRVDAFSVALDQYLDSDFEPPSPTPTAS